jgi:hypothetical protein
LQSNACQEASEVNQCRKTSRVSVMQQTVASLALTPIELSLLAPPERNINLS